MKPAILLLAISPWMTNVGCDEFWSNQPWFYRKELAPPPSLYIPLDGLPLVRPRNYWRPRLCCPIKPTA
jgi:hypothetical protein